MNQTGRFFLSLTRSYVLLGTEGGVAVSYLLIREIVRFGCFISGGIEGKVGMYLGNSCPTHGLSRSCPICYTLFCLCRQRQYLGSQIISS